MPLFWLSVPVFAGFNFSLDSNKLKYSIAIGPSWTAKDNAEMTISPYETDSVVTQHASRGGLFKLGLGYDFSDPTWQNRNFFNALLIELNLYHQSTTLTGDVWQYQDASFNTYSFTAPLSSTRLMLDIKPNLYTWHQSSFYPILGLGASWNNLDSFNETAIDPEVDSNSALRLTGHTRVSFAYDLGVGMAWSITKNLSTSLEYLYTNFGTASTSSVSSSEATLSSGPQFSLASQSLLFGLTCQLA